jgi:raffinose/stachyose/melibiose transport system substrate-binding protein
MQANGWQATRTALAGGGGPDIVTTPGPSWAVELARAGQLLPLDDFAAQFGWDERFVPWALDLGRVDGTLYSLPTQQETVVVYYNKTLFDEKGWSLPKTLDELTALSEQIAADGIIPFAHGNQEWRPANHWYLGEFLNQAAGPQKVYDFLTGKAKITDPEFVRAVDLLTQYQQSGWFMGGLENYYTTTQDAMHAALGDGEAAMLIEGTWFLSEVDQFFGEAAGNSNEWGWFPMPSTDGEPTFDLGIGSTYSINPATADPEAAAEFLDYLFSPESQARLLIECGSDPAPVKVDAAALEGVDPRHIEIIEELNNAAGAGSYGYLMWTFFAPKVDSFLTENIERVWAGEMTADELLAEAQAIHDEEMAAGSVPPLPTRGG